MGISLELKSSRVQLVVHALLSNQFVVASTFNNTAVIQHHNGIRIAHRGEAVSNDEDRASFHEVIHAVLDQ